MSAEPLAGQTPLEYRPAGTIWTGPRKIATARVVVVERAEGLTLSR